MGASVITVTGQVGQDTQGEQVGVVTGDITVGQELETVYVNIV